MGATDAAGRGREILKRCGLARLGLGSRFKGGRSLFVCHSRRPRSGRLKGGWIATALSPPAQDTGNMDSLEASRLSFLISRHVFGHTERHRCSVVSAPFFNFSFSLARYGLKISTHFLPTLKFRIWQRSPSTLSRCQYFRCSVLCCPRPLICSAVGRHLQAASRTRGDVEVLRKKMNRLVRR